MKITEVFKKIAFAVVVVGALALMGCGEEKKAPEKKAPTPAKAPEKKAPAPAKAPKKKAPAATAPAPKTAPSAPAKPQ